MNIITIILSIFTILIPIFLGFISWRNHNKAQKTLDAFESIRKNNEAEFLKKKDTLKYR